MRGHDGLDGEECGRNPKTANEIKLGEEGVNVDSEEGKR